jgi:MerR family transcriptional regulator, light-induced transcriptional regulator
MAEPARDDAPRYSLGAVARLLGVTPHLLRAWERRYGAVHPARTPGGTRRYSAADVARLRLLRAGVEAGHPISEIAALSRAELERCFGAAAEPAATAQPSGELLRAVERMDAEDLERRLALQLSILGARDFARTVALPLLREVGERWRRGEVCIAAEHTTSAILRSLLGSALRFPRVEDGPRLVFATPTGERHELGLLTGALCAQERGARVVYLGADLPVAEVVRAAADTRADAVVVGVVSLDPAAALREIEALRRALPPAVCLWLGGEGAVGLTGLPEGVRTLVSLDALEAEVDLLRAAS